MYLESSSLANNAYYAKYGFEVQRDIFLERGRTPVQLSIMVREPRAARKSKPPAAGAATAHQRPIHVAGGGRPMAGMNGLGGAGKRAGMGLGLFHVAGGGNGAKIG